MYVKIIITSLIFSIFLTTVSDVIFKELHLTKEHAAEYNIKGLEDDERIVAKGTDFIKFYRSRPLFYLWQNKVSILTAFFIALFSSIFAIRFIAIDNENT